MISGAQPWNVPDCTNKDKKGYRSVDAERLGVRSGGDCENQSNIIYRQAIRRAPDGE